jgi:hypothetical protein
MAPYRQALHIRKLLDLPLALCHSTLGHFLSYPEGREIATAVLEEGIRLYCLKGRTLANLPVDDPQGLLQRLRSKPREFDKGRALPDRAFGAALPPLLQGALKAAREANERIVRLASQTGVDPKWNWALTQKLGRVPRVGFFRDPVELYAALSR